MEDGFDDSMFDIGGSTKKSDGKGKGTKSTPAPKATTATKTDTGSKKRPRAGDAKGRTGKKKKSMFRTPCLISNSQRTLKLSMTTKRAKKSRTGDTRVFSDHNQNTNHKSSLSKQTVRYYAVLDIVETQTQHFVHS